VRVLARASIAAVGDVLMHWAVQEAAAEHRTPTNNEGFDWLWAPVADLLRAADLTFANLETPIAPRAVRGAGSFAFNAEPVVVTALRHAGVDLLNVANNHVFDQGRAGFEETLRVMDEYGMKYVGAGEAGHESGPRFVKVNGIRIAFLAYARFFNAPGNDCPVPTTVNAPACLKASLLEAEGAAADVRAAARGADVVVVSLHWGEEYQQVPLESDVALAHRLAEAGALIILGHHPHVLQPLDLYRRANGTTALIAYSLGNFISNQSRNYVHGVTPPCDAATRDGVLLRVEVARREYGSGVTRVELTGVDWLPLWTENDTVAPERRVTGRSPAIQVVAIDRALARVRAELAAMAHRVPPSSAAHQLHLRQREDLYLARRAAIAAVLGEDLRRVAPPLPGAPAE
jgi:poly-gamma-glutamate synthesis protein (capsule biosynthesis protein)